MGLLLLLEQVEEDEDDDGWFEPMTRDDDDLSDDRLVATESEFNMIPGMVECIIGVVVVYGWMMDDRL